MDGSKKNRVGRPRAADPMIKIDNARHRVSAINNLEIIAGKLGVSFSELVRSALDKKIEEYKGLLED